MSHAVSTAAAIYRDVSHAFPIYSTHEFRHCFWLALQGLVNGITETVEIIFYEILSTDKTWYQGLQNVGSHITTTTSEFLFNKLHVFPSYSRSRLGKFPRIPKGTKKYQPFISYALSKYQTS